MLFTRWEVRTGKYFVDVSRPRRRPRDIFETETKYFCLIYMSHVYPELAKDKMAISADRNLS